MIWELFGSSDCNEKDESKTKSNMSVTDVSPAKHKEHRALGQSWLKLCHPSRRIEIPRIFQIVVLDFAPKASPECCPKLLRIFCALFPGKRRPQKVYQNSLPFFIVKSQVNPKKRFTKAFWRAGKGRSFCYSKAQLRNPHLKVWALCAPFSFPSPNLIDDRQITHLICVHLKYLLYDFLGGALGLLPVVLLI